MIRRKRSEKMLTINNRSRYVQTTYGLTIQREKKNSSWNFKLYTNTTLVNFRHKDQHDDWPAMAIELIWKYKYDTSW